MYLTWYYSANTHATALFLVESDLADYLHLAAEVHDSSNTAISQSEKVKLKVLTMPWRHIGEAEV